MRMEKLIALLMACVLAWIITPRIVKYSFAWGAVDLPGPRKVHGKVMPRLGGVALYVAFVLPVLLTVQPNHMVYGLLLGATLIMLVGVIDDIRGISPWVKLGGQVIAALSLIPFGVGISFVTNPLNGHIIGLGWWGIPVTLLWVVAVTNAVNLIDGLDGLAGGVSCIAALTIAAVGWTQWKVFGAAGQQEVIILALILAAALVGFLRHNFYPARIFLGDSGAMLLGFVLATMAVMGLMKSIAAVSIFIPPVILGIPLLDVVFAVFRRCRQSRPIFQADREHLHHQLLDLGLSHRQAVLAIYGVSALLGVSAVILNLVTSDQAMVLLVILATATIVSAGKIGLLRSVRRTVGSAPHNSSQHLSKM